MLPGLNVRGLHPKRGSVSFGWYVLGADGEDIPGAVGEPLLLPAPVVVGAGLVIGQIVVDVVLVLEAGSDAVGDVARGIGEFPGVEEEVLRIVAAYAVHHRRIEGIQAENPVELVGRERVQLLLEFGIVGKLLGGEARGGS